MKVTIFSVFFKGTTYIDPLRYLGVACVLTGSFCVCLAMCRWLSKPISVSGHHVTNLEVNSMAGHRRLEKKFKTLHYKTLSQFIYHCESS